MRFFSSIVALSGVAAAAPFRLPNGFPNPSAAELVKIQRKAGGFLPPGPLPSSLKADAIGDFSVIAINEIFEVAYFSNLIHNITHDVPGYQLHGEEKEYFVKALRQIRAQEEVHAIGANAILAAAGATPIKPCEYRFGVTNLKDAIALASTFTDVVLGALQTVQQNLAVDGGAEASALVPLLASIIGQEGEQDGAFRAFGRKVPSAATFLTNAPGEFAFNAVAQNFLVPGSCGKDVTGLPIPIYKTLAPTKQPTAKDGTVTFETDASDVSSSDHLTYITGQLAPVVVPIKHVVKEYGKTRFQADFPFSSKHFSKGLTLAAITKSKGPFANSEAVAAATIAGPGLIEVD